MAVWKTDVKQIAGGLLGVLGLVFVLLSDCPFKGLSEEGWRTLGLAFLMAVWWMAEVVPITVTSFLPLILAPLLGIGSISTVSSSYSHPLIFLFFGGFLLSLAIEKTGLHLRIACMTVAATGSSAKMQIGGMMAVTAFLSMWISNTATAVMMLPIAVSIISLVKEDGKSDIDAFAASLLLGIAYGASIGGLATIIGTPPNALLAAYLSSNYNLELGFGRWMLFGVPLSLILLLFAWLVLTKRGVADMKLAQSSQLVGEKLKQMGEMTRGERYTLVVFLSAASLWIFRSFLADVTGLEITDTGVAMAAGFVLFLLPSGKGNKERLLEWRDTVRIPWGVLLLFGGGLALAALMKHSGLADYIGTQFASLSGLNSLWVILVVVAVIVFLTEITSNTATAAGLLPLMGPVAISMGEGPLSLTIPAAIAASCAFMLPVATPPNAIIFGSGELKITQMIRAGFTLNLVAIVVVTVFASWIVPLVFAE